MNHTPDENADISGPLMIVGVGLIGGSIALSARKRNLFAEIVGVGRSAERLQAAVEHGVIDRFLLDKTEAAQQAGLVVVCTPVDRIAADIIEMLPSLNENGLITDAGSVKGEIVKRVEEKHSGTPQFLGSHPMAGSEKTGWEHSDPDLFCGRPVILTPTNAHSDRSVQMLGDFWSALGAEVRVMDALMHDRAVAAISHLPHAVAAALVSTPEAEQLQLASTGFEDSTRIAASDPGLWEAIFQLNATATLEALDAFTVRLQQIRAAIDNPDRNSLHQLLDEAQEIRRKL